MLDSLRIILLGGFVFGITGSLHCIGMCGPLALALPLHSLNAIKKTTALLLYNVGRASSYAMLGLLLGSIGQGFSFFASQRVVSLTLGIVMIVYALFQLFPIGSFPIRFNISIIQKLQLWTKRKLSHAIVQTNKNVYSFAIIGILNGLLPCGFVYLALGSALTFCSALNSAAFMFSFGLGTIPSMLGIALLGNHLKRTFAVRNLSKASSILMLCASIFLVLRGLNLGIPYLSPKYQEGANKQIEVSCCKKPK